MCYFITQVRTKCCIDMRWILVGVLVVVSCHVGSCLVMTSGGVSKVILGYSIPVDVPMPMGINYVHNFQFQYTTVDNASQVSYVQQGARSMELQRPRVTRKQIYSVMEQMLDNSGLDRTCLLRSVCESSASPIVHSGLIGELLQTLLTPYEPEEENEYSEAWRAGHQGRDCLSLYPQCPHGHTVLDHISYYM